MATLRFSQVLFFVFFLGLANSSNVDQSMSAEELLNDKKDINIAAHDSDVEEFLSRKKLPRTATLGKLVLNPGEIMNPATAKELASALVAALPEETKETARERIVSILGSGLATGLAAAAISRVTGINPLTVVAGFKGYERAHRYYKTNIKPPLTYRMSTEYQRRVRVYGEGPLKAMNAAMDKFSNEITYIQTEPKVLLGCEFDDINAYTYNYREKRSKWGNELPPMVFESRANFETFIRDLSRICASVLESTTYNDVDQLIRFIAKFKSRPDKSINLEQFYKSYKYELRYMEDTAIFELQVINRLKVAYPEAVWHFYLITAYLNIPQGYSLNFDEKTKELSEDFLHDHVAGAFRIEIEGRKGYIILDLTIGTHHPIILMDDGNDPEQRDITSRKYKTIIYRFCEKTKEHSKPESTNGKTTGVTSTNGNPKHSSISPFVVAKVYDHENDRVGEHLTSHLYFVRQPYCSFLDITYKPNLLIPVHGMLRRQRSGFKSAQLNFRILPKTLLGGDYVFNIVSYAKYAFKNGTAKTILFDHLDRLTQEQDALMEKVAEELGTTKVLLWAKLKIVKSLIFDDDNLVQQLYELNKKYQMINEEEVRRVLSTPRIKKETLEEMVEEAELKLPDETVGKPTWQRLLLTKAFDTTRQFVTNAFGTPEEENEFRKATERQNEYVKKTHVTNFH